MADNPGPSNVNAPSTVTSTTTITEDVVPVQVDKLSPLEGIKVIDLTRIVAGPFCTMLLGDLGAEIIKIEQPGYGDESRRWAPFVEKSGLSCYFISLNRNKKSVCVNLKTPAGREIIQEMARKCDVLVENYVPGKLDSYNLGYNTLKEIAPHLIYCSITGYGQKGPYKSRSGLDIVAASVGGLLHVTGPKDGEPCKTGLALTDIITGLYAYSSIMAALLQKEKTGLGQRIDCNLLSSQLSCLINIGSNYLNVNEDACRFGTAHRSIVPYESFSTSDGYLTVGALSDVHFHHLCKKLSLEHLNRDCRFINNSLRVKNRELLITILKTEFKNKTTKEWLNIFEGSTFPYGPVNTIAEVFEDDHVKDINIVNDIVIEKSDTTGDGQETVNIKLIGPAVNFSSSENKIRSPPPKLGQHTDEVLKEILNYSDVYVEQLKKTRDVQ